ncbi:hypothetical protein ACFWHT_02630 [Microbacterium sp. NPDC058342]|uniref:hypothetical protein n=1 Tax=Microbacterium sp. NPDC058342 TaxID=3346454 RepID=UPI003660C27C
MSMPNHLPYAVFSGALGDTATGGWFPAQAAVSGGVVTLWVASPTGWTQRLSVPASQVTVKSAAQRITLVAAGQSFPILADPGAVNRALGLNAANVVAGMVDAPIAGAAATAGRGVNQVNAAQAFSANGGGEFLAAMRASGARVSRLGYGAIVAIGCGGGLLAVIAVTVITLLLLNL